MRLIGFVGVLFMLAACAQPTALPTPGLTPTRVPPRTATTTITVTATPTQTATPTVRPTATPLPTATADTLSAAYTLPAWLADPTTPVLASLLTNAFTGQRDVSLINAATGESYAFRLPPSLGDFVWDGPNQLVFLTADLQFAASLNLTTGQVETTPVPSLASPRYAAQWVDVGRGSTLSVTAAATGETVWASAYLPDVWGTEFAWSPANESVLAFVQGQDDGSYGFITANTRLTVVNVSTGAVLGPYAGDFGVLAWSPDGTQLLYLSALFNYRNFGFGFMAAPCVLTVATGASACLPAIPARVPADLSLATTALYHWSADGQAVYYTYLYTAPDRQRGEFCRYALAEAVITCPTAGLIALDQRSLINYNLSPDERYVHFCYSASSLLNDYADVANDGLLALDGTSFVSWVGEVQDGGPPTCSRRTLWRPLP